MTDTLWARMLSWIESVPGHVGVRILNFALSPDPEKPTANGMKPTPSTADRDPRRWTAPSRTSLTHADLACWLVDKETGLEADPAGLAAAAERVYRKLSGRLSRSVSPAGSQAILSRALHLTRAEFPFLEGVRAGKAPERCFEGLDERVHHVDVGEARQGLLAVLGTLLDLLVRFIGEELTVRLVRDVWPDLPSREPSQPGNSDGRATAP
jgi:hypothetical protein